MKQLYSLFLAATCLLGSNLLGLNLLAQQPAESNAEIPWLRSATEAAMLSQKTGKPILVYIRSKNCHYCDLLQKNTWQNPETRTQVMRDMIPLKLTLEENKEAVEAMKVKGFPSVVIFSPRREYLARMDGYMSPEQFQSKVSQTLVAQTAQPPSTIKR
jgi:thioredoxin-related protein